MSSPEDKPPFPLEDFLVLPKAELHVHLEGTVDARTLLDLASRHGATAPGATVEDIERWYSFDGFEQFLERYFRVIGLLRDDDDFACIAERYLLRAHDQGVVHVEFHVSATGHIIESGHRWSAVQAGIVAGCEAAAAATGISWALIPDISPHLPEADVYSALDEVLSDCHERVVAVGMGGPAHPHWWDKDFARCYEMARDAGLRAVAHAGEHGGADEVRFAIEHFGVERIQHGIGAMSDPFVVELLVGQEIACDVCPGSNLALRAVTGPETHPLAAMVDAGVKVTLGSDDPPLFHTCLTDEYRRAWDWCDLEPSGLARLARHSLEAAFVAEEPRSQWLADLAARS